MTGLFRVIWIASFFAGNAFGIENESLLKEKILSLIGEKIPKAEIRISNLDSLLKTAELKNLEDISSVRFAEDRENGVGVFEIVSTQGDQVKVQIPYEAWIQVPVAARKIYPNNRLKQEDFRMEAVNLSKGIARNYRGSIILDLTKLVQMETRQTILEGQFVPETAVRKTPDVRKGETVKLEIHSGEMSLFTSAVTLDVAVFGDVIHVITYRTKREMSGILRSDRTVEVRL